MRRNDFLIADRKSLRANAWRNGKSVTIKEIERVHLQISFTMEIELAQGYISCNPETGDVTIRSKALGIPTKLSRREYVYVVDALRFCQNLEDTYCDQVTLTDHIYGEEIPLVDNAADGRKVSVQHFRVWKDSATPSARREGHPAPPPPPTEHIPSSSVGGVNAATAEREWESERRKSEGIFSFHPMNVVLSADQVSAPYCYVTKLCCFNPNVDRCTGFYVTFNDPLPTFC